MSRPQGVLEEGHSASMTSIPLTSRFPRLSYMLYTRIDDTGHTDGQNY